MIDTSVTYQRVQATQELWLLHNSERENAIRDMVAFVMSQHCHQYSHDRWEGDSFTPEQVAREHHCSCWGDGKKNRLALQRDIAKIKQMEFRGACYYMLRDLMPMMLKMRLCLDATPDGIDIAKKFDELFYESEWRG